MNARICGLAGMLGLGLTAAGAAEPIESIELFNARTAPEEAWGWSDARIRDKGDRLVVTEINKRGSLGNVFPEHRFPYHPRAEIHLDCREAPIGAYSFQVMAFAGDTLIGAAEPIKDAASGGRHRFGMAGLALPPETQAVLFKIWVSGAEGASVVLDQLRYTLPVAPADILFDESFDDAGPWTAEHAEIARDGTGVRMTLRDGRAFGNFLIEPLLARRDGAWLLVHTPEVRGGTLTIQLAAFDAGGEYIGSVDALPAVGGGWHGIRLGLVNWPDGAEQFRVKIWLSGAPAASARVDRLLLLDGGATGSGSTSGPTAR